MGGEDEEGVMTRQRMTEEEWKAWEGLVGKCNGQHIPLNIYIIEMHAILAAHRELVWARKVVEAAEYSTKTTGWHVGKLDSDNIRQKCKCRLCAALAAGEE